MTQTIGQTIKQFKGLKNDEDSKQISFDYFYRMKNFNFSKVGLIGVEKILMPKQVQDLGDDCVDGLFEYRYLDSNSVLQKKYIAVSGGTVYSVDLNGTKATIKTGLSAGLVSFAVFNDLLYIANGKNYINVYYGSENLITEMGAPLAVNPSVSGNLNGTYYYALTYVTAAGEEVIGSVSNTVTVVNGKVNLKLPLGYSGTTSRKIYRTTGTGSTLKLVYTVGNNTDLTYIDDIADVSLTTTIPSTNNELPKPYFVAVANQILYGAVTDKYPTQVYATTPNFTVWDWSSYIEIANYGNDNSPVKGIGIDFSKPLVGTERNIYLLEYDSTSDTHSVIPTRANIGIKNGYTIQNLPAFQDFQGGLIFVSTLNDVRVMSGLQALPVSTSIDNVRTDNWAQPIRGSLESALKTNTNLHSAFYDYKYHLLVNYTKYVLDIRLMGWTFHDVQTTTYHSQPKVLAVINNNLYNGQIDGYIEKEYSEVQYRSEDVESYIESPHIVMDTKYKMVNKFILYFLPSVNNTIELEVVTDDNSDFFITQTFSVKGGVYNKNFFNSTYYLTDPMGLDYRVFNINRNCRWLKYRLTNTKGNISFQGFGFEAQNLTNKEM